MSKGVAWVKLNRPERLNAINDQMLQELTAVLETVDEDKKIRCLVLTGEGRAFCPGQDLNDRNVSGGQRPDLGETVGKGYNPFLRRFYNLRVPTIAAVNGVAAGAGANIALACDIVIAADVAKFIQVYSNIGLIPDAGGSFILPRLVGMARAKELTFSARPVKAEEAVAINMISRSVPADDLMNVVREMAEGYAEKPTFGLENIKKALHASFSNDLDTQLDMERDLMQKCGFSDDYSEGVSAFLEKRKPIFKGR
tara:strand:- start:29538 stop:30299 length:762 start_codon:yes stop_codon:yes gene_type:complete